MCRCTHQTIPTLLLTLIPNPNLASRLPAFHVAKTAIDRRIKKTRPRVCLPSGTPTTGKGGTVQPKKEHSKTAVRVGTVVVGKQSLDENNSVRMTLPSRILKDEEEEVSEEGLPVCPRCGERGHLLSECGMEEDGANPNPNPNPNPKCGMEEDGGGIPEEVQALSGDSGDIQVVSGKRRRPEPGAYDESVPGSSMFTRYDDIMYLKEAKLHQGRIAGSKRKAGKTGASKTVVTHAGGGDVEVEEEEDWRDDWQRTGSEWVGKQVTREFQGTFATGTVTKWLPAGPGPEDFAMWHVVHQDGDEEDLEEREVIQAI